MNLAFIFYISFALFVIGLFGAVYFKSITAIIISVQFIAVSAVINFLSFSQILYENSASLLSFVIISVFLILIFQFVIIFYLYSNLNNPKIGKVEFENNLFYFNREEWLGEK
ncbi:hypothetical protein LLG07_03620 [bacterium]|nr:hypothetical protein [bacterium]